MAQWVKEPERVLQDEMKAESGVIAAMRTTDPPAMDTRQLMVSGQKLHREKGMGRSVAVPDHAVISMQFERPARESGNSSFERYVVASNESNWIETAIVWICDNKESAVLCSL